MKDQLFGDENAIVAYDIILNYFLAHNGRREEGKKETNMWAEFVDAWDSIADQDVQETGAKCPEDCSQEVVE